MKLTVLHISDLHRDLVNPIRNDVLIDTLQNDERHYTNEEKPPLRSPDLIIVSGDIIQGIRPDVPDPEEQLRKQYEEALNFLSTLTDRFLGGDRDRVVIVPGNHDVSAYHLEKSMRRVDIETGRKKELASQLFSAGSMLRWSWKTFELYEIVDQVLYTHRLAAFADFYKQFYENKRTYELNPEDQFDIFDLPNYNLAIVGFSSCFNNDVLNKQGAIHPGCIAGAGKALGSSSLAGRIRIAVWHHNAEGAPMHSAYMDPDLLQNLIDRGFSLGFHGHQHRPQFLDTRFRYGTDRKLTVISAGTLCGDPSPRCGRAYNIVELDTDTLTGRLCVREMYNDDLSLPIWGRRALPPNTNPYYEFQFDPPPKPIVGLNTATRALNDAQALYRSKNYREAADVLISIAAVDALSKPLLLDCLMRLKDMPALIANFDPPTSVAEAIHLMDALWEEGRRERLLEVLYMPLVTGSSDPSLIEIREKYAVRLSK